MSAAYRPLAGMRVVEFATVGAVPFAALLLAQHGAEVLRIAPPTPRDLGVPVAAAGDIATWDRDSVQLNLKTEAGRCDALDLVASADVLIEGFRPGVMERLGLGPEACHRRNHRLIYGRLTGWGQTGPWAHVAGHDINYIGMTGALAAIGEAGGRPVPPLNVLGDLAGGALYLVVGILAAGWDESRKLQGCVIDAAMVDGSLHTLSAVFGRLAQGAWQPERGSNVIDGGVPWYRTYETADGKFMAVGAIEQRFYDAFVAGLGFALAELPSRSERRNWAELEHRFSTRFKMAPREHWERIFDGTDTCVTPVLDLTEALSHPIHQARRDGRLAETAGARPQIAPRFCWC
ncbi:CaiB/BaiF CoA transferase family protein [Cupriavidus sp. YAF13]|uniref:CaiB/BaiF CoA transferase family protein n=1 Tax=Cupriavidus sp. YAF13 TaxID=3233075 RepID=UPI003F8E0A7A